MRARAAPSRGTRKRWISGGASTPRPDGMRGRCRPRRGPATSQTPTDCRTAASTANRCSSSGRSLLGPAHYRSRRDPERGYQAGSPRGLCEPARVGRRHGRPAAEGVWPHPRPGTTDARACRSQISAWPVECSAHEIHEQRTDWRGQTQARRSIFLPRPPPTDSMRAWTWEVRPGLECRARHGCCSSPSWSP